MQTPTKTRIAIRPVSTGERQKNRFGRDQANQPLTTGDIPLTVERAFFILRWLVTGLALVIQLYVAGNAKNPEAIMRAMQITALVGLYNGAFSFARTQLDRTKNRTILSVLDAGVISLAIGLSGGIYSAFLVLIYLVVVEASFNFTTSNALTFTALAGGMFVAATMFIGGQPWTELNLTVAMSEVLAMFIFVSVGSSMVSALDQQREIARREKELSAQLNHQVKALSSLNRLSERLNASLELEELMKKTMAVLPEAFEVDAAVTFLTSPCDKCAWNVNSCWYGLAAGFEPVEGLSVEGRQIGPLVLSQSEMESLLDRGLPLRLAQEEGRDAVLVVPLHSDESIIGGLALLRQSGPVFSETDQELLSALGRQMSLLIRNARLYELERQNVVRLQELEQLKSDFLSIISHDLRTPLTSIKASTILMLSQQSDEVNETEQKLLRNIDRNTDRLNGLVSDLLDMAKLQNGRLKLNLQNLNLTDIVMDVAAAIKPLVDRKNQQLITEIPERLPYVHADRRRIEQILTNLISNANRYTQSGGEIRVKVVAEGNTLTVAVADNGPGIPEQDQAMIFERFYRATANTAGKSGTGLGLSIAQSLAELHGGQLRLESTPGRGSTFYFSLPLQAYVTPVVERTAPRLSQVRRPEELELPARQAS